MNLCRHVNFINREAIDVFFAGRVGRQKGLRSSAWVSRLIYAFSLLPKDRG
jgi:hypothetical protein